MNYIEADTLNIRAIKPVDSNHSGNLRLFDEQHQSLRDQDLTEQVNTVCNHGTNTRELGRSIADISDIRDAEMQRNFMDGGYCPETQDTIYYNDGASHNIQTVNCNDDMLTSHDFNIDEDSKPGYLKLFDENMDTLACLKGNADQNDRNEHMKESVESVNPITNRVSTHELGMHVLNNSAQNNGTREHNTHYLLDLEVHGTDNTDCGTPGKGKKGNAMLGSSGNLKLFDDSCSCIKPLVGEHIVESFSSLNLQDDERVVERLYSLKPQVNEHIVKSFSSLKPQVGEDIDESFSFLKPQVDERSDVSFNSIKPQVDDHIHVTFSSLKPQSNLNVDESFSSLIPKSELRDSSAENISIKSDIYTTGEHSQSCTEDKETDKYAENCLEETRLLSPGAALTEDSICIRHRQNVKSSRDVGSSFNEKTDSENVAIMLRCLLEFFLAYFWSKLWSAKQWLFN